MNYKDKQDWIEAVMASDLSASTKVYAYGIFKHMYGTKDDAFPSGKAIKKATGLATGKYYLHNKALADAGFLEVTHRRGKVNFYRIIDLPTEVVTTSPQMGEHLPTEVVTPPHKRGTNTTKNTTKDTSMENNKDNTGPVAAIASPNPLNNEVKKAHLPEFPISFKDEEDLFALNRKGAFYVVDFKFEEANEVTPSVGNTPEDEHEWDARKPEDWFAIMRQRPLTAEENEYRQAKARAYNLAKREAEPVAVGDDW